MSPASGDVTSQVNHTQVKNTNVSIQLMSPASGDFICGNSTKSTYRVSIQLMSPASGDMTEQINFFKPPYKFPFN